MNDEFEPDVAMDTSNVAALVLSQEMDSLTDVLVTALTEVFRILDDNIHPGTIH